ncbi:SMP-30/gluconolactonase/LRE family protein [Bacillaceae bacterium SIJ1]|uniref:SMP-30/gluconolactonase/LRE family protein n=1 Tax=Litoribacterium kuwaitense TaxID=1398745 RepID=UPI0013ED6A74|nr:SMP-30/gluconolactonase/LRE family protein [Litoribacterium kuwaitense]NGP46802.1 SMP-30/gluconolactonase/LRE family protein [Litoribacterium kuwaitense]
MVMTVELLVDAQAALGEGPCWNEKEQKLYWVNILGKSIHRYDPETDKQEAMDVGQMVGAIAPCKDGRVVLAMQDGFFMCDWETQSLEAFGDPESHLPDNRFNDGKCDPAGRFWAGTMRLKEDARGHGALYCLEPSLDIKKKLDNIGTSNGIAWSPDAKKMYYIDTPTQQVVAYDYDIHTGAITNGEAIITIARGAGFPDGMTIDAEGNLWIAHWGGSGISHWNPQTGKQLDFIDVPALNVTSCVFGGPDLKTLYITSARTGTSAADLKQFPHAGGVFTLEADVKGSPTYTFG